MSQFNFNDLEEKLNKLGDDIYEFVGKVLPENQTNRGFNPGLDVYKHDGFLVLVMDLPGMSREEVSVTYRNKVLTISGDRKHDAPDGAEALKNERSFGRFSRSFAIPGDVNSAEIKARFNQGVLRVSIPDTEQEINPETINID